MKLYVYFDGQDEFTNTSIQLISPWENQIDVYTEEYYIEGAGPVEVLAEIKHVYPVLFEKFKENFEPLFQEWPE